MKKIAFFETKPYDRESFDRANQGRYDICYFETRLKAPSVPLAEGCDAACAFVNAEIDAKVVEGLVKRGVKILAMHIGGQDRRGHRQVPYPDPDRPAACCRLGGAADFPHPDQL